VAKLTAALTPSSPFSLRSILAAQDAQVIPPIVSSAVVTWSVTEVIASPPSFIGYDHYTPQGY
jgi:hypothetical protein